jgi:hypothetical protein
MLARNVVANCCLYNVVFSPADFVTYEQEELTDLQQKITNKIDMGNA